MTLRPEILPLLFAIAAASFACRAGGFWVMRFIPVTPRLRAMLAAAPLAVMMGIVTPAALHGGMPELGGLAATLLAMRLLKNDLAATFIGIGAVALLRLF